MSSTGGHSAYGVLLRRPGVVEQAAGGLLSQVTQGAGSVGIILVAKQYSEPLALAGAAVGALSLAAGMSRPVQGRIIDRRGSAGLMAVCGVVHAAALAAIVPVCRGHLPGVLLVAVAAAAGVALPPVSTSMRVVWGEAVAAPDRVAAYSLTYLIQEFSILLGPLLLAAAVALSSPSSALIAIAVISALGTLAFAVSVRAEGHDREVSGPPPRSVLRAPGIRVLAVIALLVGAVIGGLEVGAPASATAHHQPAAGGLLFAAVSLGGIAGGAIYGGRRWGSSTATRIVVLLCVLTMAVSLAAVPEALVAIGLLLLVAGAVLNPALTTISLLVDEHVPGRTAAEAFGWLSTGIAGGGGLGSAIAGTIAGSGEGAFVVAGIAGAAATITAVAARRILATRAG